MSIRSKLYSGFAVVLVLTAIGFLTALSGLDQLREGFSRYERQVGITNRISKAESRLLTAKGAAETFVLSGAKKDLDIFSTVTDEARAALSDALARADEGPVRAKLEQIRQAVDAFDAGVHDMAAPHFERTELWNGRFMPASREMEKALNEIIKGSYIDQDIQSAYQAAVVQRHLLTAREEASLFFATGEDVHADRFAAEMKQMRRAVFSLELKMAHPERVEMLGAVSNHLKDSIATFKRVVALTQTLDTARAAVVDQLGPELAARLASTRDTIEAAVSTDGVALDRTHNRARATTIGAIVVATLIAVIIAALLSRAITRPIARIRDCIARAAEGDLTTATGIASKDEVGAMAHDFDQMQLRLRDSLARVMQASGQVLVNARELDDVARRVKQSAEHMSTHAGDANRATGDADQAMTGLSSIAEELSSNAQAVGAAVNQIGEAIANLQGNADNVGAAMRSAVDQRAAVGKAVEAAMAAVTDAAASVERLNQDSAEIGTVNQTIIEMSRQTNLLALNASIEAARAGAAGKGFAVVAGEVKRLAAQSAEAAESVNAKIQATQSSTHAVVRAMDGVRAAIADVDTAMGRINDAIAGVDGATAGITTSIAEQVAASREISDRVEEVAAAAHRVASAVADAMQRTDLVSRTITGVHGAVGAASESAEHTNGAATSLSLLAQGLEGVVRQFTIDAPANTTFDEKTNGEEEESEAAA